MRFKVIPARTPYTKRPDKFYLVEDEWNDWWEFRTLYSLVYIDVSSAKHLIGSVKIGQFNMADNQMRADIPRDFNKLEDIFFSLGQDDSYYNNLTILGEDIRNEVLEALRDVALDLSLFERSIDEKVTKVSLLREVSQTSVKGQYNRLALGSASLSQYHFTYNSASSIRSSKPSINLSFHVEPRSNPPTNVHVLIGRNGVGKTFLLNNMVNSLIEPEKYGRKAGSFSSDSEGNIFASLVSVTFSAFDETEPPAERKDKTKGIKYSYIGLKRTKRAGEDSDAPKSPVMLKNEFVKSVETCSSIGKTSRWKRALLMLEADPIFKAAEVSAIAEATEPEELKELASTIFNNLSSGHKIVLLSITRLIETVEERTLVLIDEPEAHLHPPLLSAFIRALSDLLIQRNAVAIIATHSPVVLQEVPKSCVWKLRRNGSQAIAERLEIEAFGENVGILTREVFGLEVTHSGFHKLLKDAVKESEDYDSIVDEFNNELGMEAKAIIRALLYSNNNQ